MTGWVFDADHLEWQLFLGNRPLCCFSYNEEKGYFDRCYRSRENAPWQFCTLHPGDAANQAIELLGPEERLALLAHDVQPPGVLHGWYESPEQHLLFFHGKLRAGCTANWSKYGKYWVEWQNVWQQDEIRYRRVSFIGGRVKRTRMRTIVENLYLTPEERLAILVAPT